MDIIKPNIDLEKSKREGYEVTDASIKFILGMTLGTVVLALFSFVAMFALFEGFDHVKGMIEKQPALMAAPEMPPEPHLQVIQNSDLKDHRGKVATYLNSFGWNDREAGVVRIPIERAKYYVLKNGLPKAGGSASAEGANAETSEGAVSETTDQ